MTVGDWAQIASAVGALAAVIVALFGPRLQRLLLPPRLEVRLDNALGAEAGEWVGDDSPYISSRYYHLRVANPHRWSPVTAVRVFLLRVELRRASGEYELEWEGEVPMQWRFPDDVPPVIDIGFPRDCDLFSAASDGRLRFKPDIQWALPGELQVATGPVDMRLTLQARGLQADSRTIRLELKWDGAWPLDSSFNIREV
jgi:hypothetical protein